MSKRCLPLAGLILVIAPAWARLPGRPEQPSSHAPSPVTDPLPATAIARLVGKVRFVHDDRVCAVALSPDGKTLAAGGVDRTVRLWDLATGKEMRRLFGHPRDIHTLAISPDGTLIATGSQLDPGIFVWDIAAGRTIQRLPGHRNGVASLAFSPDGKRLASGGADGTLRLWDAATGSEVRAFKCRSRWLDAVAFSPDGKTLALAGGSAISLWTPEANREVRLLQGCPCNFFCLAFAPDGKSLIGGWDSTIALWDVAVGKRRWQSGAAGAFSHLPCLPMRVLSRPGARTVRSTSGTPRLGRHGPYTASATAPSRRWFSCRAARPSRPAVRTTRSACGK